MASNKHVGFGNFLSDVAKMGQRPGAMFSFAPNHPPIPAYIVNILTGTVIEIALLPEEISENYAAEITPTSIMGRSSPVMGYAGGGPKTVSLSLTLHDDYCKLGIIQTVNNFKALSYPEYSNIVESPNCYLRIGDFMRLYGVCTSVGVSWSKPMRRDHVSFQMTYIKADVSLDLQNCVSTPFSASSVEGGSDSDAF